MRFAIASLKPIKPVRRRQRGLVRRWRWGSVTVFQDEYGGVAGIPSCRWRRWYFLAFVHLFWLNKKNWLIRLFRVDWEGRPRWRPTSAKENVGSGGSLWLSRITNLDLQFARLIRNFEFYDSQIWILRFVNWILRLMNWILRLINWILWFVNWILRFVNWIYDAGKTWPHTSSGPTFRPPLISLSILIYKLWFFTSILYSKLYFWASCIR